MDKASDDKKPAETSAPTSSPPATASTSGDGESLEGSGNAADVKPLVSETETKKKKAPTFKRLLGRLNIYFLLFLLIVVLAIGLVLIGIAKNKKTNTPSSIASQQLSQSELDQLKGSNATVGDSKQTLTVESNAIFNGAILVKGNLDVAGAIKVGGALNLPGITVSGASTFDQITANKLSIAGDTNIQGQLTVQKGLTVTGGATFGGPISAPQLTIQSLQLNSDLQINKHIDTGGAVPSKADGGGLGGGGTTSVNGSDTAGTVTINFGGGASSTACYITITFVTHFPATPHVVISPTSPSAASLQYYVNRNSTNFQVCSNGGTASGSASFDYIVIN